MRLHSIPLSAALAALALSAPARPAAALAGGHVTRVAPADPADSLHRVAREALNAGDYRRAASIFHDVRGRFPRSAYVGDAMYYEAFSLSRTGDEHDMRSALEVLREQRRRFPDVATRGDAAALATRVEGELARRGNSESAARIAAQARGSTIAAAGAGAPCGDDDADMRIAALNALLQMDGDRALPILKKVLARRDACSVRLRRKAVFLVAQKHGDESADILLDAARTDPDREVQSQAIFWLSEVGTERAAAALDSILTRSTNPEMRERAITSLGQHGDARSARVLRDFAASDAPASLRSKAVFWLGQGGRGADAGPFLRSLFEKEQNEEIREQIVQAVAERADADDARWLMGVIENAKLPIEVRKKALFWAGQARGFPVPQLVSLYDRMADRELKEQAIWVLAERRETAATDKVLDIARHDPDRELRKKALFWLGQNDDPRVKQLLMEILGQ
jgi:HEAT repeat protein